MHIRCRSTATATMLDVQDNSLSLSSSQQGHLFGLFRRLHNHVNGAGVSLYTLKKNVENGGDTVTVQSELNVGFTFIITLPAPEPATA